MELDSFHYTQIFNINHIQIKIPSTYKQAINSEHREHWIKAMDKEYYSITNNQTYDLVPLPRDVQPIGCRWVYNIKHDPSGNYRFKARLVAQGYTQRYGVDFDKTYAPTARLSSLRILLNMAVQYDFVIHHCDVDNAYLNSDIDRNDIYMKQPPGYETDDNLVCRLNKSLYGLKQSAHLWNNVLISFMTSQNLEQSVCDPCVFVRIVTVSRVSCSFM